MITIYRRYIARSWTNDEFLMNLGELHHNSHFASVTWISRACPVSVCAESEVDDAGGTIDFPSLKVGCYIYRCHRKLRPIGFSLTLTLSRIRKELMQPTTSRKVEQSQRLQKRAAALIPGGVNSPVRAFGAVGGDPRFIVRGKGSRIWDADENELIDYVGSWGPLILGHAAPDVLDAILAAVCNGTSFGASTPVEADLAELVISAFPHLQKIRFVSSGTEATMSAIRLARAYTKRKYIMKFEGCYHGHADALLVKAGSGVATLGIPGSAGVPEEFTQLTLALPFNDTDALEQAFKKFEHQIACVIVEPVVGNMGCVPPAPQYLDALREITLRGGALLIFDEVMTGFRLAFGGAQERYGILPDR